MANTSSPAVLDSGFRAASLGYLKANRTNKIRYSPGRNLRSLVPTPSPSVFHFFNLFLRASQLLLPFPSAQIPGRAQHCLQKFLNLVGVCVYFSAIQQEWELPSWAQLLYSLSSPRGEVRHQDRKRGSGRTRKGR